MTRNIKDFSSIVPGALITLSIRYSALHAYVRSCTTCVDHWDHPTYFELATFQKGNVFPGGANIMAFDAVIIAFGSGLSIMSKHEPTTKELCLMTNSGKMLFFWDAYFATHLFREHDYNAFTVKLR